MRHCFRPSLEGKRIKERLPSSGFLCSACIWRMSRLVVCLCAAHQIESTIHLLPGAFRLSPRCFPPALAILRVIMASESRWSRSSGFALHTGRDAREKTMPVLRLILDPEGAAFDVNDAMLIGVCAAQLASQLGYPIADSSGMPVNYQLRLTTEGS